MRDRRLVMWMALALGACERPAAEPQPVPPMTVVDSILPVSDEIRRFRAAHWVAERSGLRGGRSSRDALVHAFVRALAQRDTAALRALVIDAGEFIELYYPASPYAKEPYRQSPAFVWFQFQQHSDQGIVRALDRFGGVGDGFSGYQCTAEPRRQGRNRLWEHCLLNWKSHASRIRMFGAIIERDGHFKFVSYTNDF